VVEVMMKEQVVEVEVVWGMDEERDVGVMHYVQVVEVMMMEQVVEVMMMMKEEEVGVLH
jgi:hypothetical protein